MIITGLLSAELRDPKVYREFWGGILTQISSLMSSLIVWITLGINIRNSTEANYRSGVTYIKDVIDKIEELTKTIFTNATQPFLDFTAMFYYLLGDANKFAQRRNSKPELFASFIEARFHNVHLFENLMSQLESILACDTEKYNKDIGLETDKLSGGIYSSSYASSIESSMPKEFVFSILLLSLLNRYDLHTYTIQNQTFSWKESTLQLLFEKNDNNKFTEWKNVSRVQRNFIDLICPFFLVEAAFAKPTFTQEDPCIILKHIEKVLYEDRKLQAEQTQFFYGTPINMMYTVASKVSLLKKSTFEQPFLSSYKEFLLKLTHSCLLRYIETVTSQTIKNSFLPSSSTHWSAVIFFVLKDLIDVESSNNLSKDHTQIPWEELTFLKDIEIFRDEKALINSYATCYREYIWEPTTSQTFAKFPTLKSILKEKHHLLKKKQLFPYVKTKISSQ